MNVDTTVKVLERFDLYKELIKKQDEYISFLREEASKKPVEKMLESRNKINELRNKIKELKEILDIE